MFAEVFPIGAGILFRTVYDCTNSLRDSENNAILRDLLGAVADSFCGG